MSWNAYLLLTDPRKNERKRNKCISAEGLFRLYNYMKLRKSQEKSKEKTKQKKMEIVHILPTNSNAITQCNAK